MNCLGKTFRLMATVTGLSLSACAVAETWQWQDEDGSTVYSDQKSSAQAKATAPSSNNVNYYTAPATEEPAESPLPKLEVVEDAYAVQDSAKSTDEPEELTEAECQELYGVSCDRVINWKKYALEACGNDTRCDDPEYLERKYRPRLLSDILTVAHRASIRKNRRDDEINHFLKVRYTNFCEKQTEKYCESKFGDGHTIRDCKKQLQRNCEDDRGLEEVVAEYKDLSPYEQQQILKKARMLALEDSEFGLGYDQILARLIDLMLAAHGLGL